MAQRQTPGGNGDLGTPPSAARYMVIRVPMLSKFIIRDPLAPQEMLHALRSPLSVLTSELFVLKSQGVDVSACSAAVAVLNARLTELFDSRSAPDTPDSDAAEREAK